MDEEFVICPFNKSHIISRLRIQYHLVKCRKMYPFTKKVICPYDATEYIDPINFTSHLCQCKKQRRLDVSEEFRQKQYESIQHGDSSVQTFLAPGVEVTDEWNTVSDNKDNDTMTCDEIKNLKYKNETSIALQKACAYSPVIIHPVGRGRGINLYQNYMDNLQVVAENSTSSQSVSYFPNTDKMVLNENKDASPEKDGICCIEEKVDEGIFDDAEEPMNHTEVNNIKSTEKCSIVDVSGNNNVKTCSNDNLLNYYTAFKGRGLSKNALMMGRGAAIRSRTSSTNILPQIVEASRLRPLDHILKDVILNVPNRNILQSSDSNKLEETVTQLSKTCSMDSDLSRFSDYEEKNESKEDRLSSDSLNCSEIKSLSSSLFVLDDRSICFSRSGVKKQTMSPQDKSTRKSLDSLLYDIVKKLPATSLEDKEEEYSSKTCKSAKDRNDSLEVDEDYFPMPSMGRGHIFKDQLY